ncbi:MAG: class I tRNA ligase family protein, partial [Candidatus Aminicenantes bacterium]|nr:class I tRNA ligase family protein [Candidatus Aminicenantes bacterium]
VDLATAKHGRTIFTYLDPETGKEFDVMGSMPELPAAKVTSERFEVGRAFATKLWNAMRFALLSLDEERAQEYRIVRFEALEPEDRWILGRLREAVERVTAGLRDYNPSQALGAARDFFWSEFCDWYLELVKPRLKEGARDERAAGVLACVLDQVLRLLHPFVPFVTEALWERLNGLWPRRGVDEELHCDELLISAAWPVANEAWRDAAADADVDLLQGVVRAVRNWRSHATVAPSKKLRAVILAAGPQADGVKRVAAGISHLAGLNELEVRASFARPKTAAKVVDCGLEIFLLDAIDVAAERKKLEASLVKKRKDLSEAEKRLANPSFLERAPAAVVTEEKRRQATARREIELLERSLADLE